MATVIGKTSTRIDQLLGGLVTSVGIVDGRLIVVDYDGAVHDAGPVGGGGGPVDVSALDVAYSGSAGLSATNVEAALDELDAEKAALIHVHSTSQVNGLDSALSGKASTSHTHDDRYFTETEVTAALSGKASTTHNHDERYFTQTTVTNALNAKANTVHDHDDRYYTEAQVDTALSGKANVSHDHNDLYYTETETNTLLGGKASSTHTHDERYFTQATVNNALNGKANTVHDHDDRYFTETEVTAALSGKANVSHNHNDLYYTEAETNTLLDGKASAGHGHNVSQIVGLSTALGEKAELVHTHDDRYYTEAETNARIAAALGTVEAHANPSFDLVSMSTAGPGEDVVPSRLLPDSWGAYWGNGSPTTRPVLEADPSVTYTGSGYSYKITLPATDSGQALTSSVFAVAPGSIVNVEGWVRGTGPRAFITIYTNQDLDPDFFQSGNAGGDTAAIKPTTTWQKVNVSFTVPAGHNRCRFMLRQYADGPNSSTPGTIWWDETKSRVQIIPPSGVVVGEIKMWPSAVAPAGYLLCNGGTFSATTYPILAALLGNTFGTRSGDTCYLPDFRNRAPLGAGASPDTIPGKTTHTLGQKGGEEKHTMLQEELATHTHVQNSHNHGGATTTESNFHSHPTPAHAISGVAGGNLGTAGNWNSSGASGTGANTQLHTHTINGQVAVNQNTGSSTPFNVLSPYLGVNFIIKAD